MASPFDRVLRNVAESQGQQLKIYAPQDASSVPRYRRKNSPESWRAILADRAERAWDRHWAFMERRMVRQKRGLAHSTAAPSPNQPEIAPESREAILSAMSKAAGNEESKFGAVLTEEIPELTVCDVDYYLSQLYYGSSKVGTVVFPYELDLPNMPVECREDSEEFLKSLHEVTKEELSTRQRESWVKAPKLFNFTLLERIFGTVVADEAEEDDFIVDKLNHLEPTITNRAGVALAEGVRDFTAEMVLETDCLAAEVENLKDTQDCTFSLKNLNVDLRRLLRTKRKLLRQGLSNVPFAQVFPVRRRLEHCLPPKPHLTTDLIEMAAKRLGVSNLGPRAVFAEQVNRCLDVLDAEKKLEALHRKIQKTLAEKQKRKDGQISNK